MTIARFPRIFSTANTQRAEGVSASDLAALLEVTAPNIYYWRRRLRELDGKHNARESASPVPGLVRVEVRSREEVKGTEPASSNLEVRLAHSRSILVPSGFDSTDLRDLVMALEAC